MLYAILNCQKDGDTQFFGVKYNVGEEPNTGYQAATYASGFITEKELDDFATKNNINLT
jgi:hypothetical protein